MTNFNELPAFDIREVLKAISDEKIKLAEAAGAAVAVELKMRFLAQISDAIRQQIPIIEANLKKRKELI